MSIPERSRFVVCAGGAVDALTMAPATAASFDHETPGPMCSPTGRTVLSHAAPVTCARTGQATAPVATSKVRLLLGAALLFAAFILLVAMVVGDLL